MVISKILGYNLRDKWWSFVPDHFFSQEFDFPIIQPSGKGGQFLWNLSFVWLRVPPGTGKVEQKLELHVQGNLDNNISEPSKAKNCGPFYDSFSNVCKTTSDGGALG